MCGRFILTTDLCDVYDIEDTNHAAGHEKIFFSEDIFPQEQGPNEQQHVQDIDDSKKVESADPFGDECRCERHDDWEYAHKHHDVTDVLNSNRTCYVSL